MLSDDVFEEAFDCKTGIESLIGRVTFSSLVSGFVSRERRNLCHSQSRLHAVLVKIGTDRPA
jgi:hypothetical protein